MRFCAPNRIGSPAGGNDGRSVSTSLSAKLINDPGPGKAAFQRFGLAGGRLILHNMGMAVTLPIKRMSRADKLRAMEALWADLSRDEAEFESPGWHGVLLRETEQLVRDGKAKFSDWQTAKRRIHRKAARMA